MEYFIDTQTGREYQLYEDVSWPPKGYYYSSLPCPSILFDAGVGRWLIWDCTSQSWRRKPECEQRYHDRRDAFRQILPPEGLPSAEEANRLETEKLESRLKDKFRIWSWDELSELTWEEREMVHCSEPNIDFDSDGGCTISDDWTWDCALGYHPMEWWLDAENTKKLLALFNMETDGPALTESQKWDFLHKLEASKVDDEELDELFERLGISTCNPF